MRDGVPAEWNGHPWGQMCKTEFTITLDGYYKDHKKRIEDLVESSLETTSTNHWKMVGFQVFSIIQYQLFSVWSHRHRQYSVSTFP